MTETTFRVLDPDGRILTEVVAECMGDADEKATAMGYDVIDYADPHTIVAREAHVHDVRRMYRTDGSNTSYLYCPACGQTVEA